MTDNYTNSPSPNHLGYLKKETSAISATVQKWQDLFWGYKLGALLAFLAGLTAILYALFGNALLIGGLSLSPLLLTVGVIIAAITPLLHIIHTVIQPNSAFGDKYRALPLWQKALAGTLITLGLIAIIAAIYLPTLGVLKEFFSLASSYTLNLTVANVFTIGGAAMAGLTVMVHFLTINSDPTQKEGRIKTPPETFQYTQQEAGSNLGPAPLSRSKIIATEGHSSSAAEIHTYTLAQAAGKRGLYGASSSGSRSSCTQAEDLLYFGTPSPPE